MTPVPMWRRVQVALMFFALSVALAVGVGQLLAGWLG